MKRTLARLGLLSLIVGTPFVLGSLIGSPTIPNFGRSDGLSGNFVPVEAVLRIVGLLAWALWAYLAFAVLLHGSAMIAASKGARGQQALLGASSILAPKVLRSLLEFAVGGAFLAASVSWHFSGPHLAAVSPTTFVQARDARPTGGSDRAGSSAPVRETYRVRPGDSLWRIAERELGSGFRWREIYRLNQGKLFDDGRSFTNARLIYPGWVLDLPAKHQAYPGSGNGAADECLPNKEHATATSSPTPGNPISTSVLPTQHLPPEPRTDQEEEEQPGAPSPGNPVLRIPSGLLVAASFASGLLTAHLLGNLRRRRLRRLPGLESAEPSVTPELIRDLRRAGASEMTGRLDVALDAVIDAWRAQTGSWPHLMVAVEAARHVSVILQDADVDLPKSSDGTLSPRVRFGRAGPTVIAEVEGPFPSQLRRSRSPLERGLLVPLGHASDGSAVHVSATGLGQVSITGPEAGSLARQLVLAAATQGGPEDLRLVLLGQGDEITRLRRLPQVAGSHDWEAAAEAIRELQLEFVRRARLFLEEGVEDIRGHLAEHSDERLPALLVVCEEPPPALRGLVEAMGQEAPTLGAAVLTLGWAPQGTRLLARVGPSMEVETDLPCPKVLDLFLLDAPAEEQTIEAIRNAYPPESEESTIDEPVETVRDAQPPSAFQPHAALGPDRLAGETAKRPLPIRPAEPPEPPPDVLAVRCLGAYEISRGSKALPTGWKAKGRELVAYLVANPAGAPKERIIEELWPGIDPKQGSARFDRYATLVRAQARGTEDSRMYVERVGDSSYRLEGETWWVDAWEVERLVKDAERTPDVSEAVARLRDAILLYGGEFCDDAYYPWLEGVRERFRNLFTGACGRLADLLSGAREHEEAISVLDRAIEADPVCEDLVRRAMAIEAALGRRAAALARYRKLETTLDEQLGVEPDPETQGLVRRLVRPKERVG